MCYNKIGLCAQNIATTLGLISKTTTITYVIAKRKKKNLHFNLLWLLHLTYKFDAWTDFLRDS